MNMVKASPNGSTPALRVEQISKRFRQNLALDGVSFDVPEGSLTVLLGPAGAGKSTTLRTVAGLEYPDSGSILMHGHDMSKVEPRHRDVGMIFDSLALYPNKTGFENIASPLVIRRDSPSHVEERVKAIAATLRITHLLNRLPKAMSGGERQRVALARALIRTPKLCLLDEPLSSLDAMLRVELRAELRRLQREQGYTFLMATPDFSEAMAIADTVVVLREGRVIQIADPQTLYEQPVDRQTACFVGSPEMNILPAEVSARGEQPSVDFAGVNVQMPPGWTALAEYSGTTFEIGLRPEHMRLTDAGSGSLSARLLDVEPLGLRSALTVQNDSAQLRLVVDATEASRLVVGENIGIDLRNVPLYAFDTKSGARLC